MNMMQPGDIQKLIVVQNKIISFEISAHHIIFYINSEELSEIHDVFNQCNKVKYFK